MAYSDFTHFSDKLSYKTLFIPSYGLKVMNFAKYTHLQQFLDKQTKGRTFLTELVPARVADRRGQGGRCGADADADHWRR
jgi:hypothetical protein